MSIYRLDKIISAQNGMSRNDVKKIIKNGAVVLNGEIVTDASMKIDINTASLEINGKIIELSEHIYIMMNKPKGVVSVSDDKKDKTVIDLVPDSLYRNGLFPAGRLDKDTTGFVLITDDGEFAHKILAPKSHIQKVYIATLAQPLKDNAEFAFENGITLADGYTCLPAKIEMDKTRTVAKVILREGKYHQIKRMFAASDNRVVELKRVMMGNLPLDETLREGECRKISKNEMDKLYFEK